MLFSRRKRPTAVEPAAADAGARSNGDAPAEPSEIPTLEIPGVAMPGVDPSGSAALSVGPVPPAPPPAATFDAPTAAAPVTDDIGLPAQAAETSEVTSDDLEQFFAALRQVVQDARDRLPLEHEPLDADAEEVAEAEVRADSDTDTRTDSEFQFADEGSDADTDAPGDVEGGAPAPGTIVATQRGPRPGTEVAPSTAELIASLEADRDRWRERAVVWRERAMGADLLVKTLNAHMSDLQVNLEDLRAAMRMLGNPRNAPEDPPAISGPAPPNRGVITRFLESGK